MRNAIKPVVSACAVAAAIALTISAALTGGPSTRAAGGRPSASALAAAEPDCVREGKENPLPLPTSFLPARPTAFQPVLAKFLESGEYRRLGWCSDKGVRDTGPFVAGTYYGVHPAVKIYYSPGVMRWLTGGRVGDIPDGSMIIKEQYHPPAAKYEEGGPPAPTDWTIMIKDSKGAKDGWYWAEIWSGQVADSYAAPFVTQNAGFGLYCVRCHVSAERGMTFAALENIDGFSGEPLAYRIDSSWRPAPTQAPSPTPAIAQAPKSVPASTAAAYVSATDVTAQAVAGHQQRQQSPSLSQAAPDPGSPWKTNAEFVALYRKVVPQAGPVPFAQVKVLPGENYDHVVARAGGPQEFVTSNQCMSCHGGMTYANPSGNVMILQGAQQPDGTAPKMNVSPYAEWRWSPMGLAGRDPVFFSQLESEMAFLTRSNPDPAKREQALKMIVNTCLTCHGVMGKRQLDLDTPGGTGDFKLDFVYNTNHADPNFQYGALARDGISCAACHHIARDQTPPGVAPLKFFLENSITGKFRTTPAAELVGPFEDKEIVPLAMENALGITPKFDPYIKSSRMCGSCHTIDLPVLDRKPGQAPMHSLEQVTYLEWVNSKYQNEFGPPNPDARTCQDCHMPNSYSNLSGSFKVPVVQGQIAAIQDEAYPAVANRAPLEQTRVRWRQKGFARHELQGLNVFLVEMFRQFMDDYEVGGVKYLANPILGVRSNDYMSGEATLNLSNAVDNFVQAAREETATVGVSRPTVSGGRLTADVTVRNLTGHRLPSGVGFRRLFVEFVVVDTSGGGEKVVWASGRTNDLGVIVDEQGRPLPTEFFEERAACGGQCSQPHFYAPSGSARGVAITRQDQVQIYEELTKDSDGKFTTSFIRRDDEFKDNRLLPAGWTKQGPDPSLSGRYLESTWPKGDAEHDPRYSDGSGSSVVRYEAALPAGVDPKNLQVRATLYYQSIPPYYLADRFRNAPDGPATRRLYFLTSNLNTKGTPIEGWKLKLVSAAARVGG
ncbi:MAG TPA: cytochrome P460 family protein [Pyrinomonadaceae bacterium]|nr:cytochrome P460 family protein [Pyrinomonadaceae bacterium]